MEGKTIVWEALCYITYTLDHRLKSIFGAAADVPDLFKKHEKPP